MNAASTLKRLPECDLPQWHPAYEFLPYAYQCSECHGISFHAGDGDECPYCEEDDE